jgi:hypothetical protein
MDQSYRPLFDILLNNQNAKINLSINYGLIEMFIKNNGEDIINKIKKLLDRDQIEIIDTAAYQGFFPLLPKNEIIRQIERNHNMNKTILGEKYNPECFFSPSMVYTENIFEIVKKLGYKSIIIDENAIEGEGSIKHDRIYKHKGLNVFIRDRNESFKIMSYPLDENQDLIEELYKSFKQDEFLITAIDGETFGHHRIGYEKLLFYIYSSYKINSLLLKEIPYLIENREEIDPKESSWIIPLPKESTFQRWYTKSNEIQKKQLELLNFAIKVINNSKFKTSDPQITSIEDYSLRTSEKTWLQARYILDEAEYQDQFFFSSAKPTWSIDLIEKGSYLLSEAIRLNPDSDKQDKNKARALYQDIVLTALKWQKERIVDKTSKQFFEDEKPEETSISTPKLKKKEYEAAIKNLTQNMINASNSQEYEIAQSFKERITDLNNMIKDLKLE